MLSQNKNIKLIGAALGWGAQIHETELGPEVYKQNGLAAIITSLTNKPCCWHITIYPLLCHQPNLNLDYQQRLAQVIDFNQRLAVTLQEQTQSLELCVVLGGDHAIAVGTWSGTIAALQANQQFGLLWFDAHLDSNTPKTSPSQAIHGMPLALLLGYGEPALVNLIYTGAKLSAGHVVLFGVRSFDRGEAILLSSLKVRIYFMEEIRDRGMAVCLQEATRIVNQAPKGFGVTIDLDVFDPIEAPGVGSPEPRGIFSDGLLPELKNVFSHPNFKALEIAEYNPALDKNNQTLKLTQKILALL